MPAGKSPNNAFNLHKERMKETFKFINTRQAEAFQSRSTVFSPNNTKALINSLKWWCNPSMQQPFAPHPMPSCYNS